MSKTKVSLIQLDQLIREGYGVSEIAKKLGVSKGCISKRVKALKVGVCKDVVLRSASEIVDRQIDAMDQLRKINGLINGELDYIEQNIKNATGESRRELQEQRLKHVAEIRKQLSLLLEIAQALYNAEEVRAFQEAVLTEIGNVSNEVRDAIIERLNKRRAVRSTFEFHQSAIQHREGSSVM